MDKYHVTVFYQIRFKIFIRVYNIYSCFMICWSTTAREEIPRKFPREPHVFPMIVTSLDSIDNKHGVQRQVRRCRRRRNFIYYIEYFHKTAGILLLGVWCKNIRYNIPIITHVGVWPGGLSPLEKLGHPRPYFFLGDKLSGHTPTRVIIAFFFKAKDKGSHWLFITLTHCYGCLSP
jgi:hypothetical protein